MRYPKAQCDKFQTLFNSDLNDYRDIVGFDIVRFDEEVVRPFFEESTEQAITRKFGTDATKMIRELLGMAS